MSKKKICFISQFPPPMHGLSKAVDTLYNSELAGKFDFEKVDIKDNKRILNSLAAIKKSNADLFYFTISQSIGGNLRDLLILHLLRKRKVLVHLHGGYYRQLLDHDMPKWQKKMNYKAVSKLAGAIVLGPSLKWIFEGMLPAEKIFTVPNCVDDEFLMSDEEFNEKLSVISKQSIKHVLYLSNFIRTKGYPEVLEMAKLEKNRVESGEERKFHFDFAGKFFEKSEEDFFWNFVKENSLEDYITYHGVAGGDKKKELLKLCQIFVLLTRYPNEGQPISILEAMGNGMVVVTTDHAGIPDVVTDGENGIVVDYQSNNQAVQAYNYLSNIFDGKISRLNRASVIQRYTERKYLENMSELFAKF